ncbi:fructose-bisphosphate aldolase class I [Candidatus Saccharibacteria bacterium]|nr:fructose-bisphosphate aldolase class I [Candidatus Saccharibacteria bacterium]
MSKILIIGNVLKDIYLRLDERKEEIEEDGKGVKWINWGFDGTAHEFFRRTSVFSGAIVTLEVLKKFGIEAEILGDVAKWTEDGIEIDEKKTANYRYILQVGEQISYLSPSEKRATELPAELKLPAGTELVFVDRSAVWSRELVEKLLKLLEEKKKLKLAVFAPKRVQKFMEPLIEQADYVFTERKFRGLLPRGKVCLINEEGASLDGAEVKFHGLSKTELLTHLTTYSIVAASILGASLRGKTVYDSLLMAKLNIENTRLDETVPFKELEELVREEKSNGVNLKQMAAQLVARGKGILAADESGGSIHKKFEGMGIPDDYDHRRDYRNLFFTTKDLEKYVNGVILFDETARQTADDGRNFVEYLTAKGIIPGIKVDMGLANLPGSTEKYTLGLNGLTERLEEYYEMGLRFAKWRAAFEITETTPTKNAIQKNCEILAEYALLCQKARIVPIVEPEVVHDGDYAIEKCAAVTGIILKTLFAEMEKKQVQMNAAILKVNMVLAGSKFATPSTAKEVGDWTAKVLRRYVPESLAGVVFLSGGQGVEEATENLQEVTNQGPFPWPVTFSFARALQAPALEAWKGDNKNVEAAREGFHARLVANAKALKKNS